MVMRKIFSFVCILSASALLLTVKMLEDGAPLTAAIYGLACLAVFGVSSVLAGWWSK